jgi:hypothetical protein
MFRDAFEFCQPLAKGAVMIPAGVHMAVPNLVRVIFRDCQRSVNLLVLVNHLTDCVVISTEAYTSISVLGDVFSTVDRRILIWCADSMIKILLGDHVGSDDPAV